MCTKIIIALLIIISIITLLGSFVLGQSPDFFERMGELLGVLLIPFGYLTIILMQINPRRQHKPINNNTNNMAIIRQAALEVAKSYLAPYSDIWKSLILSNKYCRAELWADGTTITLKDKTKPSRFTKITGYKASKDYDLWNTFCLGFSYKTTYDDLLEDCRLCNINEVGMPHTNQNNSADIQVLSNRNIPKLDINNCSEFELTELPMINIVMAKKAIKKRDEIGGFKTIDDFFLFLKLKPHAEKQLRDRICVNKMKNLNKKIARNSERNVDL